MAVLVTVLIAAGTRRGVGLLDHEVDAGTGGRQITMWDGKRWWTPGFLRVVIEWKGGGESLRTTDIGTRR